MTIYLRNMETKKKSCLNTQHKNKRGVQLCTMLIVYTVHFLVFNIQYDMCTVYMIQFMKSLSHETLQMRFMKCLQSDNYFIQQIVQINENDENIANMEIRFVSNIVHYFTTLSGSVNH